MCKINKKDNKFYTYEELSSPHVWMLRTIAFLPLENRSFDFIGTWLIAVLFNIAVPFYASLYLWASIKMIIFADEQFDLTIVCETVVVQSICIKYALVFARRRQLVDLLESCRKIWRHLKPEESIFVKFFESKAYLVRNIVICNGLTASFAYIMSGVFVRLPPLEPNGTERRILPLRFYVDIQEEPMFTIALIPLSIVCILAALPIIPATETTSLYSVMMACGYFKCIENRLRMMNEQISEKENSLSREDVVKCVIFHQEVLKYCEEIENFTRPIYMTTVICVLYILSMMGVQVMTGDSSYINLMCLFVLHSVSLYICQWGPQHLANESGNIADAAYFASLEHKDFEKGTNEILSVIMMRAQKPVILTAGGYINLSMETFKSMITSAMSFYTVLCSFN